MKKKYTKPEIKIETFTPQHYVAVCTSATYYQFTCDVVKGYTYSSQKGKSRDYEYPTDYCGENFVIGKENYYSAVPKHFFLQGGENKDGDKYQGTVYKVEFKGANGKTSMHFSKTEPQTKYNMS